MKGLDLDWMLTIDETGMPQAPTMKQLLDRDVALLWTRDKTPDKIQYIKEVGVIYYLGDPKGPCLQEGLSEKESLKRAIENFDLPKDYQPDTLVWKLIKRYYNQRVGAAMENVIVLKKGLHNNTLAASKLNELLNEKLNEGASLETAGTIIQLMDSLNKKVSDMPGLLKALQQAEENLLFEQESTAGRGGETISSSMIEE
jgi:hypothetical protein